jgi:hypothetical protein
MYKSNIRRIKVLGGGVQVEELSKKRVFPGSPFSFTDPGSFA